MQDSFGVTHRVSQPYHIAKTSWTLPNLCSVVYLDCLVICNLSSFSIESNAGSSPSNILSLAQANCLTPTFSLRVLPVVLDGIQPVSSCTWEKPASTPTQCGMIVIISCATLEISVHFECIDCCLHHQPVISKIQNILIIIGNTEVFTFLLLIFVPCFIFLHIMEGLCR